MSAARADAPSSSGWGAQLLSYVRVLLWMLVAVLGFGVSVGVSLKAFDWFSKGFNEWEELKKGNLGVAAIFVALILASGWIVVQVMGMLSWHG
ncbi:MAG: DUF350 domain-containing protein [Myxococcales bacterium]|nr:DUF350 domain-containing protein [Myxococcales bacterium]